MSEGKIRVALGGSEGKMGKVMQRLITEAPDMETVARYDNIHSGGLTHETPPLLGSDGEPLLGFIGEHFARARPDVYVDFSQPDAVVHNVTQACEKGADCVIGTTGWYKELEVVRDAAKSNGRRIVYASNFSPGVNAMYAATELLAKTLGKIGWDGAVFEAHHVQKKDAPSGTAAQLGKILVDNIPGKERVSGTRTEGRSPEVVDIAPARVGSVVGHHQVHLAPGMETGYTERLIVMHDAYNRDVFGSGALIAVRWVYGSKDKEPGLYAFGHDVLGF